MEPGLIFAIVVVGTFALIGGMGLVIAGAFYNLDRFRRLAAQHAAELAANPPQPVRKPIVVLTPSPVSRLLASTGQVEVPPSLGLAQSKLGMWVFLASEVLFFSALIAAYLLFRLTGAVTLADTAQLNIPVTAVNTFILLTSSFSVVMALQGVRSGKMNQFRIGLFATFVIGAVFVGIQGIEWNELFRHGLTPTTNTFGTLFFVLTGFHGLHVIIGLLWLVVVIVRALLGAFTPEHNLGVETFGLYWHFVDIVWIILFTIIYLV